MIWINIQVMFPCMVQLYCLYHRDPDFAAAVGDPLLAVARARSATEAIRICLHVEAPTGLIAIPHSENTWDPFQDRSRGSMAHTAASLTAVR